MNTCERKGVREWIAGRFREGDLLNPQAHNYRLGLAGLDTVTLTLVWRGASDLLDGRPDGLLYLGFGIALNMKLQYNLQRAINHIDRNKRK